MEETAEETAGETAEETAGETLLAPFPFRPWVRDSCRKAMLWGMVVLVVLIAAVWWLRGPQGWAWDRAFGSLLAYALLFWLSLAKIWWTAGKSAVVVGEDAVYYQTLHTFRPRRVPYAGILACAPRAGTQSLGLVVERRGTARELFLNLGVVEGRHRLLALLGQRLVEAGLEPVADRRDTWARPHWQAQPSQWPERE